MTNGCSNLVCEFDEGQEIYIISKCQGHGWVLLRSLFKIVPVTSVSGHLPSSSTGILQFAYVSLTLVQHLLT
jgi:hypothetical protein